MPMLVRGGSSGYLDSPDAHYGLVSGQTRGQKEKGALMQFQSTGREGKAARLAAQGQRRAWQGTAVALHCNRKLLHCAYVGLVHTARLGFR